MEKQFLHLGGFRLQRRQFLLLKKEVLLFHHQNLKHNPSMLSLFLYVYAVSNFSFSFSYKIVLQFACCCAISYCMLRLLEREVPTFLSDRRQYLKSQQLAITTVLTTVHDHCLSNQILATHHINAVQQLPQVLSLEEYVFLRSEKNMSLTERIHPFKGYAQPTEIVSAMYSKSSLAQQLCWYEVVKYCQVCFYHNCSL